MSLIGALQRHCHEPPTLPPSRSTRMVATPSQPHWALSVGHFESKRWSWSSAPSLRATSAVDIGSLHGRSKPHGITRFIPRLIPPPEWCVAQPPVAPKSSSTSISWPTLSNLSFARNASVGITECLLEAPESLYDVRPCYSPSPLHISTFTVTIVPNLLSRTPLPSSSSTGASSHILMRWRTLRSTTRRATLFISSACGMLS